MKDYREELLSESITAIEFLISQVTHLADIHWQGDHKEWIAKNDAVNCGRKTVARILGRGNKMPAPTAGGVPECDCG